jgi:hypothetical protein
MKTVLALALGLMLFQTNVHAAESVDCQVRLGVSISGGPVIPLADFSARTVRLSEYGDNLEFYFRLNTSKAWQQTGIHNKAYVSATAYSNDVYVTGSGYSYFVQPYDGVRSGYIYVSSQTVGYPGGDASCAGVSIEFYTRRW